jgi:cell division septal protein FtsQ
LRFVLTVLGILVVAAGAWGLTRSPWLAVRHVRIEGNSHTSTAAILQAAGLAHPRQMVDLGPGAMVRSVDALPWIATTRVQRHWPDAVSVVVTERHAVAAAADLGGGWGLVDPTGRVLNLVSTPPAGLPTLAVPGGVGAPPTVTCPSTPPATTGAAPSAGGAAPSAAPAQPPRPDPATVELAGADTSAPAALSNALMVSAALTPTLLNQVTTVVALPDGTVQLALSSGGTVELGSPDQLSDKLTALVTVLSKVPVGKGTLNVSVPSAPFLTPPSSCH